MIPKSILNLANLTELMISDNEEWKELPLEILNMPKLQKLEVDETTYYKYEL